MLGSHNKMAKIFNKYFCIVVSKISGKNYWYGKNYGKNMVKIILQF